MRWQAARGARQSCCSPPRLRCGVRPTRGHPRRRLPLPPRTTQSVGRRLVRQPPCAAQGAGARQACSRGEDGWGNRLGTGRSCARRGGDGRVPAAEGRPVSVEVVLLPREFCEDVDHHLHDPQFACDLRALFCIVVFRFVFPAHIAAIDQHPVLRLYALYLRRGAEDDHPSLFQLVNHGLGDSPHVRLCVRVGEHEVVANCATHDVLDVEHADCARALLVHPVDNVEYRVWRAARSRLGHRPASASLSAQRPPHARAAAASAGRASHHRESAHMWRRRQRRSARGWRTAEPRDGREPHFCLLATCPLTETNFPSQSGTHALNFV
eukprot:7387504-Prymnesium_polylepis.2